MNSKKLQYLNPVKLAYKHNKTILRGLATSGAAIAAAFTIPIGPAYIQKQSFLEAIHLEIADQIQINRNIFDKYESNREKSEEIEMVREANRRKTDFKGGKRSNNSYKIHVKIAEFEGQENNLVFYRGEKIEKEVDNPDYLDSLNTAIN